MKNIFLIISILFSSSVFSQNSEITTDKLRGYKSLTTDTVYTDQVKFSLLGNPAHQEGRMFYDTTQKTLAYYNDETDVTLNVGQEFFIRVKNTSGSTVNDGQVVYINGAVGASGVPTVALAQANSFNTAKQLGMATHSIPNNGFGYITVCGKVHGISTSGFTAGDLLYLSPTTPGAFTNIKPSSPNYESAIGFCINAHAVNGTVFVFREAPILGVGTANQFYKVNSGGTSVEYSTIFIKGSASLDFANTAAGSQSDLTITATGATVGDPVILGVPNGSVSGSDNVSFWAWVSASNTVTIRFNNANLLTNVDPNSGTFTVLVVKF